MGGNRASCWLAILFVVALLVVATGVDLAPGHRRLASADAGAINAVYLTAGRSPVLTGAVIRELGIRPVATFAALQAGAASADAIIIDRALLPRVESRWLAEQQRQGKLIVGLDIPIAELADRAEHAGGVGGYAQGYGGRPFYSYLYAIRCGEARYGGSGSDAIYSARVFLGLLHFAAEQVDCAARPTPTPATGPARPRPTVTAMPLPRSGP